MFPGLLQTEAYARTIVEVAHPFERPEEVAAKVNARLARAQLFEEDHKKPLYWAILHESLLRQPTMPGDQTADQLDRVAELARRRRIITQVLPWNAGAHPLIHGAVMLMSFPDAPPLVYTEASYSGNTIDDPALVKKYGRAYDLVRPPHCRQGRP